MVDAEKHGRRVVQIMKDAGVDAGELMNGGVIETAWLKSDNAERDGLQAGLQYARDCNWIEDGGGVFVRLTPEGAIS